MLLTLFFVGANTSRGQGTWYQLQPDDTLTATLQYYNLNSFYIYQLNTQSDTITLKWKHLSHDIPAGWEYSLCDNIACYPSIPDSNTMHPVAPGELGYMGFSVLADTGSGQAVLRVYVYDAQHPNEGDTLTWIVTGAWTGVNEVATTKPFYIYPNPCVNKMLVDLSEMDVKPVMFETFDAGGKRCQTGFLQGGTRSTLAVGELPPGSYFIRLRSDDGWFEENFIKKTF